MVNVFLEATPVHSWSNVQTAWPMSHHVGKSKCDSFIRRVNIKRLFYSGTVYTRRSLVHFIFSVGIPMRFRRQVCTEDFRDGLSFPKPRILFLNVIYRCRLVNYTLLEIQCTPIMHKKVLLCELRQFCKILHVLSKTFPLMAAHFSTMIYWYQWNGRSNCLDLAITYIYIYIYDLAKTYAYKKCSNPFPWSFSVSEVSQFDVD